MEIKHFRLIKTIVEEGGITKASSKLFLSQSALSHQLKEAEIQLGTKIFLRINKKLVLTEVGEKIYKGAGIILGELGKIENEIKDVFSGKIGTITIGTECYTSYYWLPAVIKKFNAAFPRIAVAINFEATHYPLEKLLSNEIDLAITSDPKDIALLEHVELFEDEMVALVSAFHPWAKKKFILAEDFKAVNLIIHSEPLESVTVYKALLKPKQIAPKKITVVPLTEASVEMVKADMGVMVIARWALKPYFGDEEIKTVRIEPNGLFRNQYIARLKEKNYPDYYDYFIKFLREEIII